MTNEEYKNLPRSKYFNYSLLSSVARYGPSALKKEYNDDEDRSLAWGSIAHKLMLQPDLFEDEYKVLKYAGTVSASYVKLKKVLIPLVEKKELTLKDVKSGNSKFIDFALNAIKEVKIFNNIKKEEVMINKVLDKDFKNYLIEEIENIDDKRSFISPEDYMNISLMCKTLKENELTSKYFVTKDIKVQQILFEIGIIFSFLDKKFKAMLDLIIIDHENKTIQMADLKTGSEPFSMFTKAFFKWRYDIQAALYTQALETFKEQNNLKDYMVLNPVYIYVARHDVENPMPFFIDDFVLKGGITGYTDNFGREVKGVMQLIDDIEYARKENQYRYTRDIINRKGIEITGSFFKRFSKQLPKTTFNSLNNRPHEISASIEDFSIETPIDLGDQRIVWNTLDTRGTFSIDTTSSGQVRDVDTTNAGRALELHRQMQEAARIRLENSSFGMGISETRTRSRRNRF